MIRRPKVHRTASHECERWQFDPIWRENGDKPRALERCRACGAVRVAHVQVCRPGGHRLGEPRELRIDPVLGPDSYYVAHGHPLLGWVREFMIDGSRVAIEVAA